MKVKKNILKLIILFLIINIFSINITYASSAQIETYSPHVILMESKTGKIIYEKDAYSQAYPASTTKVMTAILTLENCELSEKAKVSHEAIFTVPVGYSHANLVENEELTVEQLLNVLLIPSANDAANVLAEHIAGSINSFCTMMNTKALEIGCKNTHFVNTNGIHSEDHYTTAYDLALIGRYAMQNDTFREIVAKKRYSLPATEKYPEENRFFNTTNELLRENHNTQPNNYYYEYANGVKTGFTEKAKDCIIASAKKDDMEFIVVIMGADKTEDGLSQRYLDCINLFNYAFENYKLYTINEKNSVIEQIKVPNASLKTRNLDVIVEDDIVLLLNKDTKTSSITPNIQINSDLTAPITKNTVIGTITYNVDGNEYTYNLLAGQDVEKSNMATNVLTIGSIIIVIFLLYKLIKMSNKSKKKKRKKNKKSNRDNYLYW